MKWQRPKPSEPSADYYVTHGRLTLSKARVNGEWVYSLTDGDELVCSGTKDKCTDAARARANGQGVV